MNGKRPHIIGLTGSIAMGKSTVAAMFADAGVPVFDADAQVRRMQGPGGLLLPEIEAAFPGTTGPEGVLREKLGAIVFADADALARLEMLVHPAVAKVREQFLLDQGENPLVVYDIPLLFEKGGAAFVDTVVVVSAPAEAQRQRALSRKGMTEEKLAQIIAQQMPDAEKRARADYVIDTGTSLEETRAQVQALVDKLKADLQQ